MYPDGRLIKYYRGKAGLSRGRLARLLGTSEQALALAEKGRRVFPNAVLRRAADILGVPFGLLTGISPDAVRVRAETAVESGRMYIRRVGERRIVYRAGAPCRKGDDILIFRLGRLVEATARVDGDPNCVAAAVSVIERI